MKINDGMFNKIYEIVDDVLASKNVSNTCKVRTYVDQCHNDFKMNYNLSIVENNPVFYLNNEPDKIYKIDVSLAPNYENRIEFIKWAKNEIVQMIDCLK